MGVTLHYKIAQETQYVKETLDRTEALAENFKKQAVAFNIPFKIRRDDERCLMIDIGGCETLAFDFAKLSQNEREYWSEKEKNEYRTFNPDENNAHYKTYPGQLWLWTMEFCKTQFGSSILEHVWCAELIRSVAGEARFAMVYDEGDYYHTKRVSDASGAIAEVGSIISGVVGDLKKAGWDGVEGGETKIKPTTDDKG